jgi:crossover junction endodeoxyribonuclease RusA
VNGLCGVPALALFVKGVPAPQGSKTAVTIGGAARVIEGGSSTGRKKHKLWRATVTQAAKEAWNGRAALDCPVGVELVFLMPRPSSAPRKRVWADTKPDIDKLERSILDSLKVAGVLIEDSRVVKVAKEKELTTGDTGVQISIFDLTNVMPSSHKDNAALF